MMVETLETAELVEVAVTFTNRERRADGSFVTFRRVPTVLVEAGDDPHQAAEQFIGALIEPLGGMVLGSEVVSL